MNSDTILEIYDETLQNEGEGALFAQNYSIPEDPTVHQFVLFLKPEVTRPSRKSRAGVLELTLATLEQWKVDIGAIRILRGDYLEQYRIMDQHYGVLNAISKKGREALAPSAEETLTNLFGDSLDQGAEVLGGHQFLEANPQFSPLALATLSDNLDGVKLGGGSYALPLTVKGASFILLNAFHAYQLEPFCQKDSGIIVLECRSHAAWSDLRGKLAGATDPTKAEKGSLRNQLLEKQDELELPDVSQGANGIHLSAGPLEGMVEIRRFLGDHGSGELLAWKDLAFGALLERSAVTPEQIKKLADNPMVSVKGESESAFDGTEEMDAVPSAELLAGTVDS